jgi:hypothetical protein
MLQAPGFFSEGKELPGPVGCPKGQFGSFEEETNKTLTYVKMITYISAYPQLKV